MCDGGHSHVKACMCGELLGVSSLLSLWVPRIQCRLPGLPASAFTQSILLLPPSYSLLHCGLQQHIRHLTEYEESWKVGNSKKVLIFDTQKVIQNQTHNESKVILSVLIQATAWDFTASMGLHCKLGNHRCSAHAPCLTADWVLHTAVHVRHASLHLTADWVLHSAVHVHHASLHLTADWIMHAAVHMHQAPANTSLTQLRSKTSACYELQ